MDNHNNNNNELNINNVPDGVRPNNEPGMNSPLPNPSIKNKPSKKIYALIGLILILVVISLGVVLVILTKDTKTEDKKLNSSNNNTVTTTPTRQICYLKLDHINCTDTEGNNQKKYNSPRTSDNGSINSLIASKNAQYFVANVSNQSGTNDNWLLDNKFGFLEKIQDDTLQSYALPINFNNMEDKIYFMQSDYTNSIVSSNILQYDIMSKATDKLMTIPGTITNIDELDSGNLLIASIEVDTASISLYNISDKQLKTVNIPNLANREGLKTYYNSSADKIFVASTAIGQDTLVGYTSEEQLINETDLELINIELNNPDRIVFLDKDKFVVNDFGNSEIFDITGKSYSKKEKLGDLIGLANPSNLVISSSQEQSPLDNISNIEITPQDFQDYIVKNYDSLNNCNQELSSSEWQLSIGKVVRDEFIRAGVTCSYTGGGAVGHFAKIDGKWQYLEDLVIQNTPSCETVNKYKFTKEIITQCTDSNNDIIDNTNP